MQKEQEVVDNISDACKASDLKPPVLEADLVCNDKADEDKLRAVVKRTKVVTTTAGPLRSMGRLYSAYC